ncbi:MAG: lipoprotein signal peptidase [Candidatus Competibacteraceae bacterium]|nr:MAG: lipoprotein signal peptidase [Candidatus Competibacteraceae bacterium]
MAAPRWCWGLSGSIVGLDQLTKFLAERLLVMHQPVPVLPSFNLMLTYNPGAAFSFLAGAGGWQRWFFLSLGTAISIALVVWLTRLRPEEKRLGLALALILGGAIGNLIDRAWLGQVIDFIQLYYDRWYWPTFNIADSAISIGAALLVLDSLLGEPRQPSNPETRS